jgi:hypothetical protein
LRSGVVAQQSFLGGEFGRQALVKGVGRREDLAEKGDRGLDLEVMRGASAAGHLLIETPLPFAVARFRALPPPPSGSI